jgi:hypothetical protein
MKWRAIGLAAMAMGLSATSPAISADHGEAPGTQADPAADITDIYAWSTDDGKLVAAIGFGTGINAGGSVDYDENLLYGIHLDTDMDHIPDTDIWIRFGQNQNGEWGVQVQGLPGAQGPVVGPIESVVDGGNDIKVFAGLRDDPFFFDFAGFTDTLSTGVLSFDGSRDSFAGKNVGAIVLEMNADAAVPYGTAQIWATSARVGGIK